MEGIKVLDAPGFGVSDLHDRIARDVQILADAVIVILGVSGSAITKAQLDQIEQLSIGLRNNVFVIWNPKSGSRDEALEMLPNDLASIRSRSAGVYHPDDAILANLRLALRAMQYSRLPSNGSLSDGADGGQLSDVTIEALSNESSRARRSDITDLARAQQLVRVEMEDTFRIFDRPTFEDVEGAGYAAIQAEGLTISGWSTELPKLFNSIRRARQNPRVKACTSRSTDALIYLLANYPSPATQAERAAALAHLRRLMSEFDVRAGEAVARAPINADQASALLDELIDYVLQSTPKSNLRNGIESVIDSEIYITRVPAKVQ